MYIPYIEPEEFSNFISSKRVAEELGFVENLDSTVNIYNDWSFLIMTNSWVVSSRKRETTDIRDEGQEAVPEERDEQGNVKKQAIEARSAWPEGVYITIKSQLSAGDQEVITHATYQAKLIADQAGLPTLDTQFLIEKASLASAATMVVGFKGDVFKDPDTGAMLEMKGDIQQRMNTIRRLPTSVVDFIYSKVNALSENPLALQKDESDSKSEPTPPLTQA